MNHIVSSGRRSERGTTLRHEQAVNVYTFLPCPVKVRFKQAFERFIDAYNAKADWPIYCPTILESVCHSFEAELQETADPAELPEVILTTPLGMVLSEPFRTRSLGHYQAVNTPETLAALPPDWRFASEKMKLGFLAFTDWKLVRDPSVAPDLPNPERWVDLCDPRYRGQLALPGHDGSIGATALLLALMEKGGTEAVHALAENAASVRHFAQMVKGMGSSDAQKRPFSVLPGPAAAQLPSTKNAVPLEMLDGPALMPLMLMARTDRIAQSKPVLDFFQSDAFLKDVLGNVGFYGPERIDWSKPICYPSWNFVSDKDYKALADLVADTVKAASPAFKSA